MPRLFISITCPRPLVPVCKHPRPPAALKIKINPSTPLSSQTIVKSILYVSVCSSCTSLTVSMSGLRRTRTEDSTRRTRTPSRSRPRSRPSSPPLHRIVTSQFPDDHSVYHYEDGEGTHVKTDMASFDKTETERRTAQSFDSESDSTIDADDEKNTTGPPAERHESTVAEVRGGIPCEHDIEDVEANLPALEKKNTSKSVRDPNLVRFSHYLIKLCIRH